MRVLLEKMNSFTLERKDKDPHRNRNNESNEKALSACK